MKVLETERLFLRTLSIDDAAFILELVNEPSWLEFIGDKGVKNLDDARSYIAQGPLEMHDRYGLGLYLAELKENSVPIGTCGLIKRDSLKDVDIGFAFLTRYCGKGYASEAALAVLEHGKCAFGLDRIVAITSPDNHKSIKLLENIGLRFEQMLTLEEHAAEVKLFSHQSS